MRAAHFIFAAVIASACTINTPLPPRTSSPEEPVRGGVAVELVQPEWEIRTLQPVIANTIESSTAAALVYEQLIEVDAATGEPRPLLGSWQVSSDGRTYSWKLANAVWSDGRPIVAEDVATALKAFARSKRTTRRLGDIDGFSEYQAGLATGIAGVVLDPSDPLRFTVRLKESLCPALTQVFTLRPLPTHVFGRYVAPGSGDAIDRAPENDAPPVASGPFVFREWRRGERLTFARNPSYWRGPPYLDGYEIRLAPLERWPDEIRSGAATVVGLAHGVENAVVERMKAAVSARDMLAHHKVQPGYTFIGWNTQSETAPALRDRRVRRALALGIDIDRFLSTPSAGTTRNQMDTPRWSWAYPSGLPTISYDLQQARQLLSDAGYALGADGYHAKDGAPLTIRIETSAHDPNRPALLQFAVDQYRTLGVRITPVVHDEGETRGFRPLVERMLSGAPLEGLISAWNVGPDPDPFSRWHSSQIPTPSRRGTNVARLASPGIDAAIEAGRVGPDCSIPARKKHYEIFNRALVEEHPYVFGYTLAYSAVATARELRGFKAGIFHDHTDIHRWWLAPEKK